VAYTHTHVKFLYFKKLPNLAWTRERRRIWGRQLTNAERKEIIRLYVDEKQSVAEIAATYRRTKKTIASIIKRHELTGDPGRRAVLSSDARIRVLALVALDPSIRLEDIRQTLALSVSVATLSRFLIKKGYGSQANQRRYPERPVI
jgi:IS30 family transposase